MTQDDPHTVSYPTGKRPAWQVVYWNGGVASGAKEATRAVLEVFFPGSGYCRIEEFALPAQKLQLEYWNLALSHAHTAGTEARSLELRELLGVKIA